MKSQLATFVSLLAALIAVSVLCPQRLNAQVAPPGPIAPPASQQQSGTQSQRPVAAKPKPPQVPPRTTLAGPWKLNADDSDDPSPESSKRGESGSSRNGGGNGGGYPGGGYPGADGGGYPGGGYPVEATPAAVTRVEAIPAVVAEAAAEIPVRISRTIPKWSLCFAFRVRLPST